MATVVNIKPNNPFAGFGQAFAQSMQQKRAEAHDKVMADQALKNQKVMMAYAAELEKKKYSADAAMLAAIPEVAEADKIKQKVTREESDKLIDQLLSPATQLVEEAGNIPGVGVVSPDSPAQPQGRGTMANPAPAKPGLAQLFTASPQAAQLQRRVADTGVSGVQQTPGQQQEVAEQPAKDAALEKKRADIAAWKAEKAAQGQVVTKDPTTGQLIVTNAKTATGLDVAKVNKIRGKQQIEANKLKLEKAEREAVEAGEELTFKKARTQDIKTMIQTDSRFAVLFQNPADRENDELAGRMAQEIFEKNKDFATFMLSLDGKSEIYVPVKGDWDKMSETDYSMFPGEGKIKLSERLRRDELLQKSVGKDAGKSYKTVQQKNDDYFIQTGIEQTGAFKPNTPNNVIMGEWRLFTGGDEKGLSTLDHKARAAFPISAGSGPTWASGKKVLMGFQRDLTAAVTDLQGKLLDYATTGAEVSEDFLVPPQKLTKVATSIFAAEYAKIEAHEAGSNAQTTAQQKYQRKLDSGELYRKILADERIKRDEILPKARTQQVPTTAAQKADATLKTCTALGVDCRNRLDPKVQQTLKLISEDYGKDTDGYKKFMELFDSIAPPLMPEENKQLQQQQQQQQGSPAGRQQPFDPNISPLGNHPRFDIGAALSPYVKIVDDPTKVAQRNNPSRRGR